MSTKQDRHAGSRPDTETFCPRVREGPALEPDQVADIISGLEAGVRHSIGETVGGSRP